MFGGMADQVDEGELKKVESLIHSMTRQERNRPDVIDKSRAQRIARGSGRKAKEVLDLVARFRQMRELMGNLGKPGGMLSKIPGLGGGLPAGMPGLGGGDFDPAALLSGASGLDMGSTPRARGARAEQARKNKRQQARKARQKTRGNKKKKKKK